ncbi:unannotated protein [freshwater metagenome]|uniref:Unannotated protein n=1 Tax=freshwater metagenome TaxID=449393 RepID=A0A6J6K3M6_9ZZZZ
MNNGLGTQRGSAAMVAPFIAREEERDRYVPCIRKSTAGVCLFNQTGQELIGADAAVLCHEFLKTLRC